MSAPSLPLDRLIGPVHAGEFIAGRVLDLMVNDCLAESVAYNLVCEGVRAVDTWLLADRGQMWTLRPDITEPAPEVLLICNRDGDQLTVEDQRGQATTSPCARSPPTNSTDGSGRVTATAESPETTRAGRRSRRGHGSRTTTPQRPRSSRTTTQEVTR